MTHRASRLLWGSLPPQSRAARDPFSRVPEPESRSCKTAFITPVREKERRGIKAPAKQLKTAPAQVHDEQGIERVLDRHA